MNARCYVCQLNRYTKTARALAGDDAADAVARGLMQAFLEAPAEASPPWFGPVATKLLEEHCGLKGDRYLEDKKFSNEFVMSRLDAIRQRIESAEDPLYAAIQFAILGNYIDFSALQGEVSFEKLDAMLAEGESICLDKETYRQLHRDLSAGKRLLYLTDNAGEIGFDRLLAEQLHKTYPHVEITFCVRGGPAANDATREDAAIVGIPFPVIDNGVCIAGTPLPLIGEEAKHALEEADVIFSKGQANVESLYGCGMNIYYAFLVKCQRFTEHFQLPKLSPLLLRERS